MIYKEGEIIFESAPFCTSLNYEKKGRYCDYCFKERNKLFECQNCHLMFYCNRNCEEFNSIHKFECRAFSEISKHQYPNERLQNASIILFLRILIKIKLDDSVIGEEIDQFNNLSDEFDKLKNDKEKIEKMTLFINNIELIMGSQFISKFTSDEIISNFGKMVLHQFEIKDQNIAIGMGIYLKPSKNLKHSCEPNSKVFFNGNKLYVKAERLILNNEDPTISFCDLKLSDSERKKFLKTHFYLECNCPRCSGINKEQRQVFLTPLQFDEHSFHEPELNLAVRIANKILQTNIAKETFKMFSLDSKDWPNRMKHIKINYMPQPKDRKNYILAWVYNNSKSNSIFINEIFKKRLEYIKSYEPNNTKEIEIITFFIAVTIIHELTHLLFRWAGFESSPPKLDDSGSFLENKLFDGEIEILTHPKSEWTQNSVHYGIRIRKSRMTRKNERIISYENYIKKCCSFEFGDNLNLYINPSSDVQEVQPDTLALKKCDESGDNDNSDSEEDDEEDSFQKMFKKCLFI